MSENATFGTYAAPALGTQNPVSIAKAMRQHLRVFVANVGAGIAFVSDNPQALVPSAGAQPSNQSCRIPANREATFVLAPGQTMYAIGGTLISVTTNAALPMDRVV